MAIYKLEHPSAAQADRAVEILIECFGDDAVVRAHGGFDTDLLRTILRWRVTDGAPYWETYVVEEEGMIQGVGMIIPVGQGYADNPDEIESQFKPGVRKWLSEVHYPAQIVLDKECFGPGGIKDTLYLCLLGVAASARGKGIAPRLLQHLQSVARSHSAPMTLNAEHEHLTRYYARFGFQIKGEAQIPVTPEGQSIRGWGLMCRP